MNPHMSENEETLFRAFVNNTTRYLEFGAGGSTIIASEIVKYSVQSVESSKAWIHNVNAECLNNRVKPSFIYANIGEIGEWGTPINEKQKSLWKNYHSIWDLPHTTNADIYFIDGRFRVACFAQICINCKHNTIIGVHDYKRSAYSDIPKIGKTIASIENIAFFSPKKSERDLIIRVLEDHKEDYR